MLDWALPLLPGVPFLAFLVILIGAGLVSARGEAAYESWKRTSAWISVAGTLIAVGLVAAAFVSYRSHGTLSLSATWFRVGGLDITFDLRLDGLQGVMAIVVAGVSFLVHLYSVGYMGGDRDRSVYFAELSFFSGSMLLLVLAGNFFLLYVAWELVGAASYLLISYYFERPAAAAAGKKAFLVTRIGDMGLLIGIFAIVWKTGLLRYEDVFAAASAGDLGAAWGTAIPLLLFAGAVGKSAQFPLHVWLPDAMEGPTPVSALIHAATMVAAGVYLVARQYPLFAASPAALDTVAWIGALTALMAATVAVTQRDVKRVLAYSTISQLGFMMTALGGGAPRAAIFHLFTHAWFKALLFLAAGSVIHMTGRQLVDDLGGLWRRMPITAVAFIAGALALSGIPPFAGFWSKDAILGGLAGPHLALALVLVVATFFTGLYAFRLVFLVFFGREREGEAGGTTLGESPPVMTVPLVLLALGALGAGFLGASFLGHPLQNVLTIGRAEAADAPIPLWMTFLTLVAGLAGVLAAYAGYGYRGRRAGARDLDGDLDDVLRGSLGRSYDLVSIGYGVDQLYDRAVVVFVLRTARVLAGWVEQVVIDGLVNGLAGSIVALGGRVRRLQTGELPSYVAVMAVGVVLVALLLWRVL